LRGKSGIGGQGIGETLEHEWDKNKRLRLVSWINNFIRNSNFKSWFLVKKKNFQKFCKFLKKKLLFFVTEKTKN